MYLADLKMLPDCRQARSWSLGGFDCIDRRPSPVSPLVGARPQFEEDALEKASLKNTQPKEDQNFQHIHTD